MLGKTHRAGGTAFSLVGFEIMRQQGMLVPDVNPLLQLAVLYPVAQWASTLPDLDHHWDSVGAKTPVNWVVHKLLHLSQPKHRSWQTHSLLVSGGFIFLLYMMVGLGNEVWEGATGIDWAIARILLMGFILGYASHLFLDAINPSGIHLYPGFKIRFVPRTPFFATGGPWERLMYFVCLGVSIVALGSLILSYAGTDYGTIISAFTNK